MSSGFMRDALALSRHGWAKPGWPPSDARVVARTEWSILSRRHSGTAVSNKIVTLIRQGATLETNGRKSGRGTRTITGPIASSIGAQRVNGQARPSPAP